VITEEQKVKLDTNIKNMLAKGASNEDIVKYANDFKTKFSSNRDIIPTGKTVGGIPTVTLGQENPITPSKWEDTFAGVVSLKETKDRLNSIPYSGTSEATAYDLLKESTIGKLIYGESDKKYAKDSAKLTFEEPKNIEEAVFKNSARKIGYSTESLYNDGFVDYSALEQVNQQFQKDKQIAKDIVDKKPFAQEEFAKKGYTTPDEEANAISKIYEKNTAGLKNEKKEVRDLINQNASLIDYYKKIEGQKSLYKHGLVSPGSVPKEWFEKDFLEESKKLEEQNKQLEEKALQLEEDGNSIKAYYSKPIFESGITMTTFEKTPKELQALPPEKLIFGLIKDYTNANNIDNNTLRQAKLINAETTAEGGKLYDVLTKPVWTTGDYFDKAKFINIKPEALQKDGNAALDWAVKLMQQNINSLGKELDQYDKLPKNYVENKIKSGEFSEEDAKNFVEEYTKKVENFNDKNRALKTVINTGKQFFGDLKRFDYYKATQDKLAKDFNFKQDFVGAAREGSLDNLVDALNYGQQKYAQVQSKLGIISTEQEVAKYLKIASDRDFDYMRYTPDYIKNMQFIEKDPKTGENKLNPRALGHSMIKTTVESYMLYLTGLGISKATGLSRLAGTNKVGDYIAGHAGILPASELYIQPDMFDEAMDKYENGEISLNELRTLPDYQAGIEGLTEMLFTPEGTVLTNLLTTDSKKLALKIFLKSATGKDVVKTFGKNATKAVTEGTLMGLGEGWEEVLGNIFNDVYNYNIKADNPDYKYTTQNTLDNNLTTIGNTFVSMLPTMLFGAGTTYLNESSGAVPKTTFYEVAQNPDEFAKYAKDFVYNSSSIKKQFPTKSKDEVWDVVKNTYTNLANTYKQALPILAKLDTEHEKIEYFTATQTINSLGKKPELTKKEEGELNKSLEYISEVNNRVAILDALKEVNPIQFLAKKIESGIESFEYNSQDISILSTIGKSLDNSLKEFENKKGYEKLVDKIKEKINLVNTNIEKLQNKPVTTTQESLINEPKQEEIAVLTPLQTFEKRISTASQEELEKLRIEIQDDAELSKEGKQLRKKILERENDLLNEEKNVTFTDGVNSVTFKKGEQVTLDEGNSYWNVEGLTEDGRLKLSRKFEKTTESITVSDVNDVKPYSFNEKEKKSKDGLEEPQGIEPIKPEDLEGFSPQEDLEAVFGKPKQIEEVSDIEAKKADIERRKQEELDIEDARRIRKTNAQLEKIEKNGDSFIRAKIEVYTTLSNEETLDEVEIITFKDGSRRIRITDSKTGELILDEKIKKDNSTTNEKFIEESVGNLDNTLKKISEDNNPNKTVVDKINAKYNEELKALESAEQKPELQIEEHVPTEQKIIKKENETVSNKGITIYLKSNVKATFNKQLNKFQFFNSKEREISSKKQIEKYAKILSNTPNLITVWWNNLLPNKTKSSIIIDLQAIYSMLMSGMDKYADAFVTDEMFVMNSIKGMKFTPGQINKYVTDVKLSKWTDKDGVKLDTFVSGFLQREMMENGFNMEEDEIINLVYEVINNYPNGITNKDIKNVYKDNNPAKDLISLEESFINNYGLDINSVLLKLNKEDFQNYEENKEQRQPKNEQSIVANEEITPIQEVSEEKPTTVTPIISDETKEFKKEVAETIEKYEESSNQFKSGNNKSSNWLDVVSKLYNQFKKEGLENYRISVVNANTIDFEYLSENTKEYWRKQSIIKSVPINELIAKDKGKYLVLSDKDGNALYFNEAGEIVTKETGKPVISNFSDGALISDKETYNKITEARKNNSTHLIDRIVYTPSKLTKKVLTTVKDIIGETPLQIVKKEDNRAYAQIGDEQQPLTSRTLTSNEVETLIALSKNLGGSGLIKEKQPLEEKNNSERYQKAQYLTNLIFSGTGKGKINFELKFGKGENNAVVTIKQTDGTWKTPTESELKDFLSKQWVNINYSLLESPVAFTTYKVEGSKVVEDTIYPSYTEFLKNNVKVPSTEIGDTNAHYNIEVGAVDDTIKAKVIEAETENAKIEIEVQPKEEKEVPLDNTPIQETPPKKIVKKEFKKKSDTKDNPLSGDLFRNRRLDNKVTEQQKQEALSWFKSHPISEFIKLNHFQDIINSDAFASWSEAGITLWSGSNFTDLYHEAWHEFSQLYLTKAQKQALYNEVRNKNFNFINSKGVKVNSLTASDFDIEEYVAEDFYKYVLSSKEGKPLILNNQPKRNSIFRRVYNFLKELVTGNTDLQTYYERLYTGNINNYKRDLNNAFFGSLNVGLKINVDGETKTLTNEETKQLYRGLDSLISNLFEEINQPIATLFAKNNVLSIVYDKIFDKFNEEYENYVDKYNNTTNELEQEALQQTITNLEYTLSNWNNVLAHHKRFSPYFNSSKDVVQFDDENNLIDNEVDEDELTRSSEIDKNNNVSSKEVAANETIYLVATLPRYENGKLAVNPFFPFVNDIVDFNNTWNQLTNTTNNTLDYEQILNKIDKLGDKNHSFKDLLQRIPTKEDILTDAQSRLKSAFINDISKPRIEEQELVLSLDEKGNLNGFYKAAAATDIDTIKKNWFENFNKIEGEYKTENEDSGVISLNTQKLLDDFKSSVMITKSDLQKADKNEIYAKRVEFLNNLGITFSDETILDPQFKDLILSENNPVTGIYLQLKKRLNADEVIINPFKDVAKYQRLLSEAELKHSSTLSTQSVKNPEGNNVWLIRQWNYTSKIYNALNDTEKYPTYQDFQNTPWLKALDENSNPYVKGAFLNSIFDLTPNSPTYGKRRTKNGIPVKLTLESYAGIKIDAGKGVKNEGTNTTSLTAFEKLVQNINTMLLYGVQEHLRYGDKSSSFATRISHVYDPVSKQLEDRSILVPREEFYDYQNKQSVVLPITAFQFLLGDLKAELIPMKRNFQTGLGNNIKNYNKNIKGLGVFEGILSKETFEKLKTQIIENDDVVETKTFGDKETQDISDVLKSLSKDIRTDIENYIEEKSKDLQKELGIKDLKSKELNNILVDRVFYVHSNKTIKNVIPSQIMYAYVVNSLLYNIEHTKIVTQDPRFYSAKGDKKNPFKRFSAWSATGNLFVVDNQTNEYIASKVEAIKDAVAKKLRTTIAPSLTTGEINSVVFKDVVRETKYFKLYIDLLAKTGQFSEEVLKSWYKAYNNITEPDGQGYVTLDELKKSKLRAGSSHWTKAHEEAYQAEADFISGKSTIGMTSEQVALFTPQKWQYAGNTTYSNIESNQQITAPVFYKFSVVPLIPSAIKGTPFGEIHDNLVKQNVGLALFESGSKMSAITNSEGNFNPFYENQQERIPYTGNYTINTINYEHLKEQVNIEPELKEKVTFSTQMRKLLFLNTFSNGVPIDAPKDMTLEQWDALSEADKKKNSSFYKLEQKFNKVIDNLVNLERKKVLEQLGATKKLIGGYKLDNAKSC
jgi:hypothetical protein